uniref:WAT1-related protein n=1 Tax=Setaria italica TaxID=4555 RepID=K4A250_SETIT
MAGTPAATDSATVPMLLPLDDDAAAAAGRGCWEDGAISLGLVGVQLAGAAYMVVVTPVLALGLDPLFLVAFGSLCTAVLTIPFAVKLERSELLIMHAQMAVGADKPVAFPVHRAGSGRGDRIPGPAAAGHEDDVPGHRLRHAQPHPRLHLHHLRLPRFLRAGTYRFERVDLKCPYTRAKILGTVVCLGGAIAMSVLQSPDAPPGHVMPRPAERAAAASWVAGCLFLLGAVLVLSGTIVMQAATMLHFPAPFTLCSVTSLIGAALTAAFQVATAGQFTPGTPQISLQIVLSLVFVTWALEKKGPVMVSMFSPTQTVGTAIFSVLFLGRAMHLGSILGMVFLFSGLYAVLWAKKKEGQVLAAERKERDRTVNSDMEKPLLF